jgi:hypothetical protein
MQDVNTLANELPRLPENLPYIVIKGPNERLTDQMFRVQKHHFVEALVYLKANNEDYHHIVISQQNAKRYPADDIVLRYLLKDEDPVRRAFQKILMKTVGEHYLSKQKCHHILNGLDFVQFSCDFVSVNIKGTQRVRTPQTEEDENRPAAEANLAFVYWGRETDPDKEFYAQGMIRWNLAQVTLYQFVSKYNTKTWQPTGQVRVPHITPNFNFIPRKGGNTQSRYALFLRSILLTHQAGLNIPKK